MLANRSLLFFISNVTKISTTYSISISTLFLKLQLKSKFFEPKLLILGSASTFLFRLCSDSGSGPLWIFFKNLQQIQFFKELHRTFPICFTKIRILFEFSKFFLNFFYFLFGRFQICFTKLRHLFCFVKYFVNFF